MNLLYAIDPDTKRCAVAQFEYGILRRLFWWAPGQRPDTAELANRLQHMITVAIERPHATKGRGGGQNPDSIVQLAWSGGEAIDAWTLNRAIPRVELDGNRWSQIPKCSRHLQAWAQLQAGERELFMQYAANTEAYILAAAERRARTGKLTGYSASVVEMLDAAAIGLHVLGRLNQKIPLAGAR